MWSSGVNVTLCSPSGRASWRNSTWKVSPSCLPVGWTLSGSNGEQPLVTSLVTRRTPQATTTHRDHISCTNQDKHIDLWPSPSSSGRWFLCVPGGWQQHKPEVLPRGLGGLHHRHAAAFVCIHLSLHMQKQSSAWSNLSFCLSDLGWDSWVIHPPSFTMVTCALCDHQGTIVQCPSSQSSCQDADSQVSF